jgi:hypoxanthine phosphoribosyltransferase
VTTRKVLHSESEIAERIGVIADEIVAHTPKFEIAVPILSGAFVFAADLLRALSKLGLDLPVEFLWLRSYGDRREGGEITVLSPNLECVRGKNVLLIDGVLDRGHTVSKAKGLLADAGERSVATVVAVDKQLPEAVSKSEFALFLGARGFLIGYGMDDAQSSRGLPYIAAID